MEFRHASDTHFQAPNKQTTSIDEDVKKNPNNFRPLAL